MKVFLLYWSYIEGSENTFWRIDFNSLKDTGSDRRIVGEIFSDCADEPSIRCFKGVRIVFLLSGSTFWIEDWTY